MITIAAIQNRVASFYGLPLEAMRSSNRAWVQARPRQVAMFLARRLTGQSRARIGKRFNRDQSTVFHAIRAVEQRKQSDVELANQISLLWNDLEMADVISRTGRDLEVFDRDAIVQALKDPRNTYAVIAIKFAVNLSTVRGIASANGFTSIGRGRA